MVLTSSSSDELNQTARIVLAMVAEGHSTGYAIKAEIERSTRLFWGASVGGIYPELRRLAASGLVAVRDDPRGQTRRHCYSVTDGGRKVLHGWLNDTSEPLFEMRNEALLRLRFAAVLSPPDRVALVQRLRDLHEHRAQALEARLEEDAFDDAYDRMTAEYALGFNRWAAGWAREAEERVAAGSPPDPVGPAPGPAAGGPDPSPAAGGPDPSPATGAAGRYFIDR